MHASMSLTNRLLVIEEIFAHNLSLRATPRKAVLALTLTRGT